MKDRGTIILKAGSVGYLSTTGMYNFWYPDENSPIKIEKDTTAEHLPLWKNQGTYLAFKVKLDVFNATADKEQYVCVWIKEEDVNS